MRSKTCSFLSILLGISCFLSQGRALVVSRGKLDVFSNPNKTECEINERYCKERRARCFGNDCCKCECDREYSTFHSPGVTYTFKNGKPLYRFNGKDTCVWNHYAHEGCRFIEESPSNSSRRFVPLIDLNKNGSLHLKVFSSGVYRCNEYQLYSKRPHQRTWLSLQEDAEFFTTIWTSGSKEKFLTLQWQKQGGKYGGLMLQLNFTCDTAVKDKRQPCIILKVKGTYNTRTNKSISKIPIEPPIITRKPTKESKTAIAATRIITTKSTGAENSTLASLPLTTNLSSLAIIIVPIDNKTREKPEKRPEVASTERPKKKMEPTTYTKPAADTDKSEDPHEERGETFWILVYVFMAFAIFEVLCVALFFIYRHRRKRKERRKACISAGTINYENHGMQEPQPRTATPPPAYPEEIELYENETPEPRYSSIQQIRNSLQLADEISLTENGILANMVLPENHSRTSTLIAPGSSIIVVPKDCVIVHASGSQKSRGSRRTTRGESSGHEMGISNEAGPIPDDNRSLYSWESFSSCYRTSTDEDYVSGSNRVNCEEDSLYEEPDKVIQSIKSSPSKTFGGPGLFALQESVIENAENANEDAENSNPEDDTISENGSCSNISKNSEDDKYVNEDSGKPCDETEENDSDDEHIYESADSFVTDPDLPYYENAYDLPEDALATCLGKPNKFALKHVLHYDNVEDNAEDHKPSLNLGMEFVNNNEAMIEGEDVKLRPTKRSTLFLNHEEDNGDNAASNC